MATVSWGTKTGLHQALSVSTALANNGQQLGGQVNPSGYLYSAWEFFMQYHTAPTAGGSIELYAVPTLDDTNYTIGDGTVPPAGSDLIGIFPTYQNANSGMRVPIMNVVNAPLLFKPLIINKSGQTIPASSGTLNVTFYNQVVN